MEGNTSILCQFYSDLQYSHYIGENFCLSFPWLTHSTTGSLSLLLPFTHFAQTPTLGPLVAMFVLCIYSLILEILKIIVNRNN